MRKVCREDKYTELPSQNVHGAKRIDASMGLTGKAWDAPDLEGRAEGPRRAWHQHMRGCYQVGCRPHALPNLIPAQHILSVDATTRRAIRSRHPTQAAGAARIMLDIRCIDVCRREKPAGALADANACGTVHLLSLLADASSVVVSVMAAAARPSRTAQLTLCRVTLRSASADHRTPDSRLVLTRPRGKESLSGLLASAALLGWANILRLLRHVCSAGRSSSPRPSHDAALRRACVAAAAHDERRAPSAGAAGWGDGLLRLQANWKSAQWARCKCIGRASGAGKYISVARRPATGIVGTVRERGGGRSSRLMSNQV